MSDDAFSQLISVSGYGAKARPKVAIKDNDLQIHVPTIQEARQSDATQGFKDILSKYVGDINTQQHEADAQVQKLASGEVENLHDVTIAMEEAQTSFQLMMEVRNKLLDAYQELNKMQ